MSYHQYDLLSHTSAVGLFLLQAIDWIHDRFAGKPAPNNCSSIAAGNPLDPLPLPSSAAARGRRRNDRTWPAGPSYGYCASHSRFFWGLRLHLVCTPAGLPVTFALAGAESRRTRRRHRHVRRRPDAARRPPGSDDRWPTRATLGQAFEAPPRRRRHRTDRARPAKARPPRPRRTASCEPFRQIIESVNHTLKAQLEPRTPRRTTISQASASRVLQRLLALTAAIWHNHQPRPTRPAITHRLRPLTPWNFSSSRANARPSRDDRSSATSA